MKIRLLSLVAFSLLVSHAANVVAAQTYAENTSVQANVCVGFDCAVEETLTYPVLMIKENNVRIVFYDSSADDTGDSWRMVANDSNNGGQHYFKFQGESTYGAIFTTNDPNAVTPVIGSVALANTGTTGDSDSPVYPDGVVSLGKADALRRLVHIADAIDGSDLINRDQLDVLPYAEQKARLAAIKAQLASVENALSQIESIVVSRDDAANAFDGRGGGAWFSLLLPLLWFRRKFG